MAGGYLLLVIPCWLILAPFYLLGKIWWMLGWVWQLLCRMSWYGLILYVPLLGLFVFVVIYHDEVFDWCRNLVGHGPSVSQEIKVGE